MKIATICFPVRTGEILLAEKKSRHGAGKLNGYGGKVEPRESIAAGACREFAEESGATCAPSDLEKVAVIDFYKADVQVFECHVFFIYAWSGEFRESDEMALPHWYPRNAIPFDRMWPSDRAWLELVLKGKKIRARAYYDATDSRVEKFEYEDLK